MGFFCFWLNLVQQKDDKCDVILAGDFRRGAPESDEIVILLAHDRGNFHSLSIMSFLYPHLIVCLCRKTKVGNIDSGSFRSYPLAIAFY